MAIRIGTAELSDLFFGAEEVNKVLRGAALIWERGGGPTPGPRPVVRASSGLTASAGSVNVPLTGALAGDHVFIFASGGWNPNRPAGWFGMPPQIGTNWNGQVFHKIITAADVTAGSVTITWGGSFALVVHVVVIEGATWPMPPQQVRSGSGSSAPSITSNSWTPQENDLVLLYGSHRANSGGNITCNTGVSLQQNWRADASGRLYAYEPSADGPITAGFTFTPAGIGYWLYLQSLRNIDPDTVTSWTSPLSVGDRSGYVFCSEVNDIFDAGTGSELVNGVSSNTTYFWNRANNGTRWILFEFFRPVKIEAFRWIQDGNSAHGLWNFEGSNDNSSWDILQSGLALGGQSSKTFDEFVNPNRYKFYRLRSMSGSTSNGSYLYEIEFKAS